MYYFIVVAFLLLGGLEAKVQDSIVSRMDKATWVPGKMNSLQAHAFEELGTSQPALRVMSFNMLFNLYWAERDLARENRWVKRASRVIEYLQKTQPDIIGSQELQRDQIDQLMEALGDIYAYYGEGEKGDILAIFYKKDRLELLEGHTYPYALHGEFKSKNTFTTARLIDRLTGKEFILVNTHLAFGNIERRLYEAYKLKDFVEQLGTKGAIVMTGDFNTFPNRPELDLPFYDGDTICRIIGEASLADAMPLAILGHFGPISSTNYSSSKRRSFEDEGTPGVILDHIFVNDLVKVVCHGIDPARVNGHYPSDHFPVIADLIFK